ncbi:MAG: 2-isopropylmalate synthase [Candidatus Eisenbacteria bacterium]|nr:2-isopropylmalate synthase [Candidatus Eisenbacteria bacterium]
MEKRVLFVDSTLRDGEQTPGVNIFAQEKLEIAKMLEELGIDKIECGFPATSPSDTEGVRLIAEHVTKTRVGVIARATKKDIDAAWDAVKDAKLPTITPFISVSPIHRKYKLNKNREEVLDMAVEAVMHAKQYTDSVDFAFEDASRAEPDYLSEIIQAVVSAGAVGLIIPDTVGYSQPEEFGKLIADIRKNVKGIDDEKCYLSTHCHNDLGLAVASSLAGVKSGAMRVEGTVNGLGERAGNAALEEVIMSLVVRKDYYQREVMIDTTKIYPLSRLVARHSGMFPQATKAIVGDNAFAHEAGIHQNGVLKERSTYEMMDPKNLGIGIGKIVLGKHSGRNALSWKLKKLGIEFAPDKLEKAYSEFKTLTLKKKKIDDQDLIEIASKLGVESISRK